MSIHVFTGLRRRRAATPTIQIVADTGKGFLFFFPYAKYVFGIFKLLSRKYSRNKGIKS